MIVLLILVALALAAFGGWRAATRYTNNKLIEENLYLRNYVEQLKQQVNYHFEQSANNREIQNATIQSHNNNLRQTLENALILLQSQTTKENLKEGEKESIEGIIRTIKSGISSSHGE